MGEIDDLRRRLDRLEKLVEAIAQKVGVGAPQPEPQRVSEQRPPSPPVPPPPPPPRPEQIPTRTFGTLERSVLTPERTRVTERKVARDKEETEFLIGRRYLPIAGAIVTILGFICLAALALSRGWISAKTQFGGELLLCAIFGAIGLRKLNEKDNFGSILVAVSLSGFYLSLTGAFFFKALLTGEAYVVGFMVVSFASHAFSWWRSSKPFLFLGLFGGLSAALMAIPKSMPGLNIGLHLLAMSPAWVLVARKKWPVEGLVAWMFSTVLACPALFLAPQHTLRENWFVLIGFWANALIGGLAVLSADDELKVASKELVVVGVFVSALAPVVIHGYANSPNWPLQLWTGFAALLGLAGSTFLASKVAMAEVSSKALRAASLWLAFFVPPVVLNPDQALLVYTVSGIVLSVYTRFRPSTVATVLAVGQTALSYGAYVVWISVANQRSGEVPLLLLMLVATLLAGSFTAPTKNEEPWTVAAGFASWLIVLQVISVSLGQRLGGFDIAFTTGSLAWLFGAGLVALVSRRLGLAVLAAGVMALQLLALQTMVLEQRVSPWRVEAPLLAGTVVAGLLLARVFFLCLPEKRHQTATVASAILWVPFARLLWTVMARVGVDDLSGALMSVAVTAVLLSVVAGWGRWRGVSTVSVLVLLCEVFPYVMQYDARAIGMSYSPRGELAAMGLVAFAILVAGRVASRVFEGLTQVVVGWGVLAMWAVACRAGVLAFVFSGPRAQDVLTIQGVTIAVGLGAAVIAWASKWRYVALSSLVLLVVALVLYPMTKVPMPGITSDLVPIGRTTNLGVLVALYLYSLTLAKAAMASEIPRTTVHHMAAGLNWALASGLFIHTLDLPPARLSFDASVSVAWTVYAASLLGLGFRCQAPVLRYWALGVFGAAILKVVFYDLAFLDPFIKVIVLIALGAVMIGGGYIYIRSQAARETQDTPQA